MGNLSKNRRRNFNNFGKFAGFKLVHVVAHPLTTAEKVRKLFAVVRKKVFTQVSVKARGAIFKTAGVIQGANWRKDLVTPANVSPKAAYVTTINQVRCFFVAVEVLYKFYTVELRVAVKVTIYRENGTVFELDSNA